MQFYSKHGVVTPYCNRLKKLTLLCEGFKPDVPRCFPCGIHPVVSPVVSTLWFPFVVSLLFPLPLPDLSLKMEMLPFHCFLSWYPVVYFCGILLWFLFMVSCCFLSWCLVVSFHGILSWYPPWCPACGVHPLVSWCPPCGVVVSTPWCHGVFVVSCLVCGLKLD